ncbi:MAG: site-2 protease family protein [Candidatus Aenigmarchaeota archaeon]|nr:site-2 protease family protein [Candidatus Aenigmarchaeota archaeon]
MDIYTISIIVFFIILGVLIWFDRKKIEIKNYILIMRRTKKFSNLIDNISNPKTKIFFIFNFCFSIILTLLSLFLVLKKFDIIPVFTFLFGISILLILFIKPNKFWKFVSNIAVLTSFFIIIYGVYLLVLSSYMIYTGIIKEPGIKFVFPSFSSESASGPGYFLIPFWIWIISVACIIIPHELFHGIIARSEKIKLKSVGLLLFAIFPGAFVEPDEKNLKKSKLLTKLRIFSAGSFANFLVAIISFSLLSTVIWPLSVEPGVKIFNVTEGSPAYIAGLKPNMTILKINNINIEASYFEFVSGKGYFQEELKNIKVGDNLSVLTDNGEYNITLSEHQSKPYMGIIYGPVIKKDASGLLLNLYPLLTMIFIFSLGVGLFNLLPLIPLDGGLIFNSIIEKYFKKRKEVIINFINSLIIFLILFNLVGPFILKI